MGRININERDLTTVVTYIESTDVVYVPGFATVGATVAAGVPTLCTTVGDFEDAFGSTNPVFLYNEVYESSWDESAVPGTVGTARMFDKGDADPGYVFAKEMLYAGLPVIYERINTLTTDPDPQEGGTPSTEWQNSGISVHAMYKALAERVFDPEETEISDKGEYSIKYITSGGYPTYEYNGVSIANGMAAIAKNRGDCVALIDHTDYPARVLTGTGSVYNKMNTSTTARISDTYSTYATMITPWAVYALSSSYNDGLDESSNPIVVTSMSMPGSFGYMLSLAKSIQTNANWLAIAGVGRGLVPNFGEAHINDILTNSIADSYQLDSGISINPITNIKPYGQCIWGNRTLKNNGSAGLETSATSYLNTRNMVSDIKKQLFIAAKSLMFEQNTDILWINFKSLITPLLDQLVTGQGISGYKIIKNTSSSKAKLNATVRIYPLYAVEGFDITVELADEEVTVE